MYTTIIKILGNTQTWLFEHGPKVLLILALTWFALFSVKQVISKVIRRIIPRGSFASDEAEKKREDTLIKISKNFLKITIWVVAIIAILSELGVPVAPLITGAGILGIGLGFGSQFLVRDIITGLFIIAENQFRMGDYICVGEYCGTVEDMTLRVTKLRGFDGSIHYVPNGEIKVASNKSKNYSTLDFKIGVAYDTDIDKLESLINSIGQELADDAVLGQHIIETPQFLRIDDFLDSSINIHILGRVQPREQFLIKGEFRKRLNSAFKKEGIEIPYPTRVVHTSSE